MNTGNYRSDIAELIVKVGKSRGKNPEGTIESCDKILEYGEAQRDDALIGFAHFSKGETYYLMNDLPLFYLEMLKCMKHFEAIREYGYLAAAYNMLGIMALNRGNAPLAMDYYYKAIDYCKKNRLNDLKCRAEMGIGLLYLSVGNYDDAIKSLEECYKYVSNNMSMEGYVETLNAILLGKGRCFLARGDYEGARAALNEAKQKCQAFLTDAEKMALCCFEARLLREEGKTDDCEEPLAFVKSGLSGNFPVMDIFDELYDFLTLLLDLGKTDDFFECAEALMGPVTDTTVKNLEKKILRLKLRALSEKGDEAGAKDLAARYVEILDGMDIENAVMTTSALSLRTDYNNLKDEIEAEKKHTRFYKRKSETDPLTGMQNRVVLNEYAEVAFERAITNQTGFGIELLDIDYFKEYNDNYGHRSGDECLIFIAGTLMDLCRNHLGLTCYRYGGDEFVIIYESYAEKEVFELAKELKTFIVDAHKVHEYSKGKEDYVTISQGIFWGVPKDGDNIWEYLKEADDLLYKVKQKSRNSIMLGRAKAEEEKDKSAEAAQRPIITEFKEED